MSVWGAQDPRPNVVEDGGKTDGGGGTEVERERGEGRKTRQRGERGSKIEREKDREGARNGGRGKEGGREVGKEEKEGYASRIE